MRNLAILTLFLAGCGPGASDIETEYEDVWLQGFGYDWTLFNHRLSYLNFGVDEASAHAAVVGGTSTTNVLTELPAGCDMEICDEFPFIDTAEIALRWGRVSTTDAVLAHATMSAVATADGVSQALSIEVPPGAAGPVSAVLRGIEIDTNHPYGADPGCYLPQSGWHPRLIEVRLVDPKLVDGAVKLTIEAAFEAGKTLEEERTCVDEVADTSQVPIEVDVLVIVGGTEVQTAPVTSAAVYDIPDLSNPPAQDPPALEPLGLDLDNALYGWSEIAFAFHVSDPQDRGAYLRTLHVDYFEDAAGGTATNYSPGTQLSGFDYAFNGTVSAHAMAGDFTTGQITATLDVALEDDGTPVVHALDYE